MEKQNTLFKTYYILAIIYSLFGIIDATLFRAITIPSIMKIIWVILVGILSTVVFVMSIVVLIFFIKDKLPKITLVVPIFHLIAVPLLFIIGMIWGVMLVMQGITDPTAIVTPMWLIGFGIITSLFELGFSIYVLQKFK